jgi:exodeoxyribonuclease VII small subunit
MAKDINYRQLSQELEMIIDQLQSGDLDIDQAIKQYEQGMNLIEQLQSYLKDAENKVTKVKKSFES